MTTKSKSKTRARELQALTGKPYQACLQLVQTHAEKTAEQIAVIVQNAEGSP